MEIEDDELWPDEGTWELIHVFDYTNSMLGWVKLHDGVFEVVRFSEDGMSHTRDYLREESKVREMFPLAYEIDWIR